MLSARHISMTNLWCALFKYENKRIIGWDNWLTTLYFTQIKWRVENGTFWVGPGIVQKIKYYSNNYLNSSAELWNWVWTISFVFSMGTGNIATCDTDWPSILCWKAICKIQVTFSWRLFLATQYQEKNTVLTLLIFLQKINLVFLWTLMSISFHNLALDCN